MATNLDKYKNDLEYTITLGKKLLNDLSLQNPEHDKKSKEPKEKLNPGELFILGYQQWYSEAYAAIKQLLPDRLSEFEKLYLGEAKRKNINAETYTIQDWLNGVRSSEDYMGKKHFNDFAITAMRFNTQYEILKSVKARFESSLFEIKQLLQADLFDSELDVAIELNKKGFSRGAGAMTGVVLEKHLSQICKKHNIALKKNKMTINDYNQLLKDTDIIEVAKWRFIQHLTDLRNLCDHDKEREPKKEEIGELIEGVNKVIKTVF